MRRTSLLPLVGILISSLIMLVSRASAEPLHPSNFRDDVEFDATTPDQPLPPGIKERVFIHLPHTPKPNHLGTCVSTTNAGVTSYGLTGWHLPIGGVKWKLNASTIPSANGLTSAAVQSVLTKAFQTWTDADRDKVFIYDGSTTVSKARLDFVNAVMWGRISAGAIGITYVRYYTDTGLVADVDTIFNSRYPWAIFDPARGECQATPDAYDVQDIATHEFGHWLGLDDLYNTVAKDLTMYGYGAGGELKRTLGSGDVSGANAVAP